MWLVFDDLYLHFHSTGHIRNLLRSTRSQLIRDGDAFVDRVNGVPTTKTNAPGASRQPRNSVAMDAAIAPEHTRWLFPRREKRAERNPNESLQGTEP
jgi:hypothetical protein